MLKDTDTPSDEQTRRSSHCSTVVGFAVLLEDTSSGPVWLADGEGDPARTLRFENAAQFSNRHKALKALIAARHYRPFRRGQIVPADEWYKLYCQELLQNRIKPTDDTEGSPVGWTIEAIGCDGSILCRSPGGKRSRFQVGCQLDKSGDCS